MTTPNPYAPPESTVADLQPRNSGKVRRYVVTLFVAAQFIATLGYAGVYFRVAKAGEISAWGLVLAVAASLCLYIATIRLSHSNAQRGKNLFLLSGLGFAFSLPGMRFLWQALLGNPSLGWRYPWLLLPMFGVVLGIAGWWIARSSALIDASIQEAGA